MTRLVIALTVISACADVRTITHDMGGNVDTYAANIAHMAERGERVRISGQCASACTMYLAIGCVTKDARLGFHSATGRGKFAALSEAIANTKQAGHYPPAVGKWFWQIGVTAKGQNLHWLNGESLIAMGAKDCSDQG